MAAWPATLPQAPLVNGYQESIPDTSIRTKMDQGAAKTRKRTTAGIREFQMSFVMTAAQVEIFETFYITTTNSGVDMFTFDHPRTGVTYAKFRFSGVPKYIAIGLVYNVSVGMELLP